MCPLGSGILGPAKYLRSAAAAGFLLPLAKSLGDLPQPPCLGGAPFFQLLGSPLWFSVPQETTNGYVAGWGSFRASKEASRGARNQWRGGGVGTTRASEKAQARNSPERSDPTVLDILPPLLRMVAIVSGVLFFSWQGFCCIVRPSLTAPPSRKPCSSLAVKPDCSVGSQLCVRPSCHASHKSFLH